MNKNTIRIYAPQKKKLNFAIKYAENTIRIYDFLTTDTPKYM